MAVAPCSTRPAGDVRDGEVLRAQAVGVDEDIDLTGATAHDDDLTNAADALELTAERLVGVLGDVANRRRRRNRERHHWRRIGVSAAHRLQFGYIFLRGIRKMRLAVPHQLQQHDRGEGACSNASEDDDLIATTAHSQIERPVTIEIARQNPWENNLRHCEECD